MSNDEILTLMGAFLGLYIIDDEARFRIDTYMSVAVETLNEPEKSELDVAFTYFKSLASIGAEGVK